MSKNTVKCQNCKNIISKRNAKKVYGKNQYICNSCDSVRGYSTQNDLVIHKQRKNNKTYGFELECIPISQQRKRVLINSKYHLIPTHDGSLPCNGIEFKTPTYNSLSGLRKLFKTFNENVRFSDSRCGQHINIGDTKYIHSSFMHVIRSFANEIFNELYSYMSSHSTATINVCGRYFTGYASYHENYSTHKSWINLSHDNRIEFRLSKFVNPNQYFCLTCMWTEMVDCIIKNIINKDYEHVEDFAKGLAHTSKRLVNIFKKYENGNAICQKRVN